MSERTRLHSEDGKTILYLPEGLDILDGLARETKLKLKEAFDAQNL